MSRAFWDGVERGLVNFLAMLGAVSLIAIAFGIVVPTRACALTIGINTATAHDLGGYEYATPGVYLRDADGYGIGVLRNSLGRTSWHVERSFERPLGPASAALTIGAITGYPHATVSPLLTLSVRIGMHRLIYIPAKPDEPQAAQALSYAIEF